MTRWLAGRVEWFNCRADGPSGLLSRPRRNSPPPLVEPVYPQTERGSLQGDRPTVRHALDRLPHLPEGRIPIARQAEVPRFRLGAEALHRIRKARLDELFTAEDPSARDRLSPMTQNCSRNSDAGVGARLLPSTACVACASPPGYSPPPRSATPCSFSPTGEPRGGDDTSAPISPSLNGMLRLPRATSVPWQDAGRGDGGGRWRWRPAARR